MAHDIRVVGNRFAYLCREDDYLVTSVGLMKLVFLAHGWHMAFHGIDNRLFDDRVEAGRLGPVVMAVYRAFRDLGYQKRIYAEIPDEANSELDEDECKTCDFVMERYGALSPIELTMITLKKGSPWDKHRHELFAEIPREDIHEYYHEMAENLGFLPVTKARGNQDHGKTDPVKAGEPCHLTHEQEAQRPLEIGNDSA